MKSEASFLFALILLSSVAQAKDEIHSLTVKEAVSIVGKPADGFANMSNSELQVHYRLRELGHYPKEYQYQKSHASTWKKCMLNSKQSMYARLCAAYFLLDSDEETRKFIETQLMSENLRHRYNAAEVVLFHVGQDPKKQWGIDLLIKLLSDGSIDGGPVMNPPKEDYPDDDKHDINATPIDNICRALGSMKIQKSVPVLIAVLERRPQTDGAATALGEIGDKRAIPILLRILKEKSGTSNNSEVFALGSLKCKEAVPILSVQLLSSQYRQSFNQESRENSILDTLLAIGDKQAVPAIEKYIRGKTSKDMKAVAKRVLVQLKLDNPVDVLLKLLEEEAEMYERSHLIDALSKYHDARTVKKFSEIARTSKKSILQYSAIRGLCKMRDRKSLLELASLLDASFPKDLSNQNSKDSISINAKTIENSLKRCTKQNFGNDRAKWEAWIKKSVLQ